jgi:hypothetical protein
MISWINTWLQPELAAPASHHQHPTTLNIFFMHNSLLPQAWFPVNKSRPAKYTPPPALSNYYAIIRAK